ncbi:MAG: CDP-alcohol phosphatidyltransferase family protein [Pseudomonadota bacterium]|nr:CDP-alcohol phosphatidyltransferase family protein [Pseudomonadota bacterium]
MERQLVGADLAVVAQATALLDASAVQWLLANPGTILADDSGRPLAISVDKSAVAEARAAIAGDNANFATVRVSQLGEHYIRKLRRRSTMLAFSLDEVPARKAETLLFANVYKGVTDLVTKYAWPAPALVVTRFAARLHIPPNAITIVGIALTVLAGWLFYKGDLAAALLAAWTMTFLDTVDGKLARVTVTSSRLGNLLDHGTDIVHPPLWWLCLAQGLALSDPASADPIWLACWLILGAYVVGRAVEISFHVQFGFNAFLYARFDSLFRLVVARRNIILLIMSIGLLLGAPTAAFLACAGWSVISTVIQLVRIGQAALAARTRRLQPWIS